MTFFHNIRNNTPSLLTHLIVSVIGILVFSTKTMTGLDMTTIAELFKGAFLALVIFHIFIFFSRHFANLFTAVLWWLLPFTLAFALGISIIAGLLLAVPQFVLSVIFAIQNRSLTKRSYQMT